MPHLGCQKPQFRAAVAVSVVPSTPVPLAAFFATLYSSTNTPLGNGFASTSTSSAGVEPSGNKRSPDPTITGETWSRTESRSPAASSQRTSVALPAACRSPPLSALSCRTAAVNFPLMTVVLFQFAELRVVEMTYFRMLLLISANGTPLPCCGQ